MVEVTKDPIQNYITIPTARYNDLVLGDQLLRALKEAGVDSWEGFEHALDSVESFLNIPTEIL